MILTKKNLLSVLTFFAVMCFTQNAQSGSYPDRPITVISNTGPGMADTIPRVLCKIAEKELGQPLIVENKPGAAGAIGTNILLKSKPDGYTLGVPVTSAYIIAPQIRKVPYDPRKESIDIVTIFKFNHALLVRADKDWKTIEEVISYARNNPGKFKYAVPGIGRDAHIVMERLAMKEGIKWTAIPFNSAGKALAASLGEHTDACVVGSLDALGHIKAGKLRLILPLGDERWNAVPDVPCILEKGYNISMLSYQSLSGPVGIPEDIIKKLEKVFNKAKKDPSFKDILEKYQVQVGNLSGKEYAAHWRSKYEEMGKVLEALGLKKE